MEATMFKTLVQIEPALSKLPTAPERAVSRTYPAVPQQDDDILLSNLRYSHDNARPLGASAPTTPGDERDLEMSVPGTPAEPADVFEALPSLYDPPMNKYRLATCCFMNFLGGLTDSAAGALIPYMETYYDIGYAVVSLIFVGNALGFITAAPFVESIRMRLGRAWALGLSQVCIACGFVPLVCAAPFPAIACAYFLIGFGYAVNLAMNNVFCANLRDGTAMLGAMHGSYGIGGTIGPLIATSIVSRAGAGTDASLWSRYYFITLGLSLLNGAFGYWSFRGYEAESTAHDGRGDLAHLQEASTSTVSTPGTAATASWSEGLDGQQQQQQQQQQPAEPAPVFARVKHMEGMLAAFRSRVVVLGAIFIFAYQGAEVSISGWVISFLIAVRGGDPSRVGYVTAGFWAGITVGRFALSPLGARGGREGLFVYALVAGAAVFQLLVWLVPNIAGEAVSLAIVGLLLGPIYPCAAAVFARNLLPSGGPAHQVRGLGVISAFGSSGGAVAPFTTGLLAQAAGTFVLHPIAIGLFGVMVLTWWGQPNLRKRTE